MKESKKAKSSSGRRKTAGQSRSAKSTAKRENKTPPRSSAANPIRHEGRGNESKLERAKKEMMVKRSSGRVEKFDANRMAQTVSRSGVPFPMAKDIAKKVTGKIANNKVSSGQGKEVVKETVDAGNIRGMVEEELRNRNRGDIASSYAGQAPENTRQEKFGLMKEDEPVIDRVAQHKDNVMYDRSKRLPGAA